MTYWVVDTNVLLVADDTTNRWTGECVLACIDLLEGMRSGTLVLDTDGAILTEYLDSSPSSAWAGSGLGRAFAKWSYDHQYDPDVCELVAIAPDGAGSFIDLVDTFAGSHFDPSDRKFFAVAKVHGLCDIAQATDSEWWRYRATLRSEGFGIYFLCPGHVSETAVRKYGAEDSWEGVGGAHNSEMKVMNESRLR